jgi:hypothetical protein
MNILRVIRCCLDIRNRQRARPWLPYRVLDASIESTLTHQMGRIEAEILRFRGSNSWDIHQGGVCWHPKPSNGPSVKREWVSPAQGFTLLLRFS